MADRALRLIFRHSDEGVTLRSSNPVDVRVPPPEPRDSLTPQTVGLFAEVRGAGGEALFTRALPDLDARMLEYPTGDPAQEFGRALSPEPVLVAVLVPADDAAREVALVRTEPRGLPEFLAGMLGLGPRRRDVAVFPLPSQGSE